MCTWTVRFPASAWSEHRNVCVRKAWQCVTTTWQHTKVNTCLYINLCSPTAALRDHATHLHGETSVLGVAVVVEFGGRLSSWCGGFRAHGTGIMRGRTQSVGSQTWQRGNKSVDEQMSGEGNGAGMTQNTCSAHPSLFWWGWNTIHHRIWFIQHGMIYTMFIPWMSSSSGATWITVNIKAKNMV